MASQSSACPCSSVTPGLRVSGVGTRESREKPEHSGGNGVWCGFGACGKPVIDPAQVMFAVPVLPWLWVSFQACTFQYHRYCVMPWND